MELLKRVLLFALLLPLPALAQRETSSEALARLEEKLTIRVEDGALRLKDLQPALLVSVRPAFEETRAWYPTEATATIARVLGAASVRVCEACMAPRVSVEEGRLEQVFEAPSLEELLRIDERTRGSGPPSKTAIWLEETERGVSLRIVDLRNARILLAENFDGALFEASRTTATFNMARELERRANGDSLAHAFLDIAVYPGQHISLEWADQWGDGNRNLSGFALSLFDPVLGLGGTYHRVIPAGAWSPTVGVKVILSVPTALIQSVSGDGSTELVDPLVTAVGIVRVPIFSSNYAVIFTASTNGRFGLGISLLNFSLLPVIP